MVVRSVFGAELTRHAALRPRCSLAGSAMPCGQDRRRAGPGWGGEPGPAEAGLQLVKRSAWRACYMPAGSAPVASGINHPAASHSAIAGAPSGRAYSRAMPGDSGRAGFPGFEEIYAHAGDDLASVPWARLAPHPLLVMWLDSPDSPGGCASGPSGQALAGAPQRTRPVHRGGTDPDGPDRSRACPGRLPVCARHLPAFLPTPIRRSGTPWTGEGGSR